jgi:phosphate transport system substrate-binding protein
MTVCPVIPLDLPPLVATGSSFASVAMQQWVGQTDVLYGLDINWQVTSSIIGLNDFVQNQVDFAASDLTYSSGQAAELPDQPYQYLPDVASGLGFMFNLTGDDGQRITDLNLDAQVIDQIFLGEITAWDSPAIVALNPQLAGDLPGTTIIPVYRTDASGDNYLLSEYLLDQDGTDFTAAQNAFQSGSPGQPTANWPVPSPSVDVGTPPFSTSYPGWADNRMVEQNVPDGAATDVSSLNSQGAITYVEPVYAEEHAFPLASLLNARGDDVQPVAENVATALEAATLNPDLSQNLADVFTDDQPTAYPLSAYSYLVTPCSPSLASAQGAACDGTGGLPPSPL